MLIMDGQRMNDSRVRLTDVAEVWPVLSKGNHILYLNLFGIGGFRGLPAKLNWPEMRPAISGGLSGIWSIDTTCLLAYRPPNASQSGAWGWTSKALCPGIPMGRHSR